MTPDEGHLADAGGDGHERSVRLRRLLRWFAPIAGLVRWLRPGAAYVEVRASGIHGLGLFAKRELHAGQTIASVSKRVVEHDNAYVIQRSVQLGTPIRHEITGKLRWLNHSCRPNAVLSSRTLKAVRRIAAGEEITIDYGPEACACRPSTALATSAAGAGATGRAVPC